jgi:hypothetical protein
MGTGIVAGMVISDFWRGKLEVSKAKVARPTLVIATKIPHYMELGHLDTCPAV